MSKEDVEIVRRLFEHGSDAQSQAGRRDGSLTADHPFFMLWHPECVLEEFDAPNGVVAATDISGRSKAGVDTQLRVYQVFRLQDGMIISVSAYSDRGQALAAARLPE